jgi:hypothetical protein
VLSRIAPQLVAAIGWQRVFVVLACCTLVIMGGASFLLVTPDMVTFTTAHTPPR